MCWVIPCYSDILLYVSIPYSICGWNLPRGFELPWVHSALRDADEGAADMLSS